MARDDEDRPWPAQLAISAVVLLVVAVAVGAVLGIIALGAANIAGVQSAGAGNSAPSLFFPSGRPTTTVGAYPVQIHQSNPPSSAASGSATGSASGLASSSSTPAQQQHLPAISLQAFPLHVGPGQRINLTGVYQHGEGSTVQVQELQGGAWTDFPVTARVGGGLFSTYVITAHTGPTKFRVLDKSSGRHSNPVTVQIG